MALVTPANNSPKCRRWISYQLAKVGKINDADKSINIVTKLRLEWKEDSHIRINTNTTQINKLRNKKRKTLLNVGRVPSHFFRALRFWYFACSRLLRLRASAFAASVWYLSIFSVVNNGV